MSLTQRIVDSQDRINGLRDQLTAHLETVDDANPSEADVTATTELNNRIAQAERGLNALREAEQRLAKKDAPEAIDEGVLDIRLPTRQIRPPTARPFNIPARKVEPIDYVWRTLTVLLKQHHCKGARSMADIIRETYDDDATATVVNMIVRNPAATAPAMTTTTGWALELVAIIMGEFWKALIPVSVYPKIAAKGSTFTFGRAGVINLPMRSITPTISGSFIGEGAPIPVRQGQFVTQQMTPKKMGVITTFTREIADHSTPAIEGILRDAVLEDTGVALDTVLLSTNAATVIAPAGLFAGITPITPTAGGGFAAVLGDIKLLTDALITATRGNFRAPAWLMSPALAISLALTPTTGAQALPFREEVARGFLMGIPIIQSTTVPAGWMGILDCADFASVTGDDPRFEVSDQAVLHMEDTTPLAIGTPGSPPTVAAPARSLWQTDTIGLRMIMPMNWVLRRAQSVALIQGVTWQ
jgi:HK97 family phage major capsid protein